MTASPTGPQPKHERGVPRVEPRFLDCVEADRQGSSWRRLGPEAVRHLEQDDAFRTMELAVAARYLVSSSRRRRSVDRKRSGIETARRAGFTLPSVPGP